MSNHEVSLDGQNLPADSRSQDTVSLRLGVHYISCANNYEAQQDFHNILYKLERVVSHKIELIVGANVAESESRCSLFHIDKYILPPFQQLIQLPLYGYLDLHIIFRFVGGLQDQNYEHLRLADYKIDNIAAKVAATTLLSWLSNLGLVSSQQSLDELIYGKSNSHK